MSLSYRADIDGIRGIAVLFVIVFHYFPKLIGGGFIGVDIFFVISGFLISGIILEALSSNSFSYVNFYFRRIKRIFPALIILLAVCLIAGWFLLFSEEYFHLAKSAIYSAGFTANIGFWLESGYFDISSSLKPLIHIWSLGVEEQFYLLWPVLLVFLYRKTKRTPTIILILLALSLVLDFAIYDKNPTTAFYMPFTRFWELMAGAFLSYVSVFRGGLMQGFGNKKAFISELLSCLGAVFIFSSVFLANGERDYLIWIALAVAGTFLLISSGPGTFINKKILSNKPLVFIGLISYPLYLWHWPLLSFANIIEFGQVPNLVRALLIVISFSLACLTYFFIEKPIRRSKTIAVPIVLFFIMLLIGISGLIVYANHGFNFRFPAQEKMLKSIRLSPDPDYKLSIQNDKRYELCTELYPQAKEIKGGLFCWVSGNGSNRIFIIGDSHTTAIYYGYARSLVKKGYTVINFGITACPFSISNTGKIDPAIKDCEGDFKKIIDIINTSNPKGIIMSNNGWLMHKRLFEEGIDKTISSLSKDATLLWFLQYPRFNYKLTQCIDRPLSSETHLGNCYVSRSEWDEKTLGMSEVVERIKKRYPQIITIDPTEALCDAGRCPITVDGTFIYLDNAFHLSTFGSKYLAEKLPIDQFFPEQ